MKIKYMGTADVRRIEKSDDFAGRLPDKLGVDLEWNWENNHVIDTDDEKYGDVADEAWELILTEPDFKDVSDMKRIPLSSGEKLWRSMQEVQSAAPSGVAGDTGPTGSSASETGGGGGGTTAGGSTRGGGGARRGGGGTTAGGST